jgi:hypothetical protein
MLGQQHIKVQVVTQILGGQVWGEVSSRSFGCTLFRVFIDALEETNNMHWFYHSFILRTGSYMLRQ